MVLGSHVIFGTYGFWLPNDPRGSWSEFIGSWELFRYGKATTTNTRVSVAHRSHDRHQRLAAKEGLKYPPVVFKGDQALAAVEGFATSARRGNVTVWACAILPEHVHLVIARHRCPVERIVGQFKADATKRLVEVDKHPFHGLADKNGLVPMCWAKRAWKVFLDSEEDIVRAIRYVEANPLKEGKRPQRWKFVVPFVPAGVN
jgi:REP element-mobilizing transposase RayT